MMPRNGALSGVSLADLERMIRNRQRELKKLLKQRARLQAKLDRIDDQIVSVGGNGRAHRGRGRTGGRARNAITLPDAIAQTLSRVKAPTSVSNIIDGVLKAGYQSRSANFRSVVNQALIKDKRFVAASRGMYQFRGRSK
jgi:hypothetical protein